MYTGTLINDLIDRAERIGNVAERQMAERQMKEELHEIFMMQIPATGNDKVYQGAA